MEDNMPVWSPDSANRCLLCGSRVDSDAKICPFCGSNKFTGGQQEAPVMVEQPTASQTVTKNIDIKKRILLIPVAVIILFALIGIVVSLISCEHVYTSEVLEEASYSMEGRTKYTCEKCNKSYIETTAKLLSPVTVTVTDKHARMDYTSVLREKWVGFTFKLENTSGRAIQSISGTLVVKKNGDTLMNLSCSFSKQPIPAYSSIIMEDYGCTLYNWEDDTVYYTDYENLTFEFRLSNVTYAGMIEE